MEKRNKIIYWIATTLLCFGMLASGISQILHLKEMNEIINHLGYPLYLMTLLGVWKILGVVAIVIPKFKLVKEWAYAGFFFLLTGALISHIAMGDSGKAIFGPLFQIIFLIVSWYFRPDNRKINLETQ
ncbi:MAG: DoxX family protein [Saprospiraceae bacterium]